ncbi:hypothetical protein [Nocardia testacea]|uniref:hypothetical protein n=1 Tax=Nocardia testacea TaxID=248551 RepID=UPI00030E5D09|nr:hypothetical protein [Nocardia testacea]
MRLTLTHLTFLGVNREPASVRFGPAVTVIRGPSDTGKSFVVDAIDFMLGGRKLKEIPEREGYSTILLGLTLPDGSPVTLSRSVNGGNFGLYREDLQDRTNAKLSPPPEMLSQQHSATSDGNLSKYLLRAVGLDGRLVRKNMHNATDSLSFRNVVHLCVVDETQMQSAVPPALTGSYVTKTKEISVLKLLLQDEDDSGLSAVQPKDKKISAAKVGVIDRLIANLEAQLAEVPEASLLREQAARLASSIDELSSSLGGLVDERGSVAQDIRKAQNSVSDARAEQGDLLALRSRFGLLQSQYASDLERLVMVREAGNLLNYFRRGVCPFCGAEPESQHLNTECDGDTTAFGEAIESQLRRTRDLAQDLAATIEEVAQRGSALQTELTDMLGDLDGHRRRLTELDAVLEERNRDLRELIDARSHVERSLGLYEQVASLEKMKQVVADEAAAETSAVGAGINLRAQREFSAALSARLAAWRFPDPEGVRYDVSEQDVIADDQLRSAHGKGVRAILHAAFTVALGQYCFERDLPHPGFVILDSPLVTYRPPDGGVTPDPVAFGSASGSDAVVSDEIARAFYHDLQRNCTGQVIIFENTDPPDSLDDTTVDIMFTKNAQRERYGFFPRSQYPPI